MANILFRTKTITFHADGTEEIAYKEHRATWPDAAVANFAKSHPEAVVSIDGHASHQVPVKYVEVAEIKDFDEIEEEFDGLPSSAFDLGSMINEEMRA